MFGIITLFNKLILDLPVETTGMTAGAIVGNAAVTPATSIHLGLNRIYVETDY